MAVARRAVIRSIRTRRPVTGTMAPVENNLAASTVQRLVDEHLLNHTNIRVAISTVLVIELLLQVSPVATSILTATTLVALLLRELLAILFLIRRQGLEKLLLSLYEDAKVINSDPSTADGFRLARY